VLEAGAMTRLLNPPWRVAFPSIASLTSV